MNISAPFIARPIGTALIAIGILLTGVVAFPLLPIAALPQVDFPTIQVSTSFAGASELTSTSSLGSSSITVQFDLDRNIDAAAGDIQAAINAAGGQLPTNLPSPPSYRKVNPADAPIMLLSLRSDSMPLTAVDDAADNILAQQLSQVRGVAQVSIFGQQKPAVRIQLDPARAAAYNLGLEDVRAQIAGASVDAPKGTLDGPRQSFNVYDNDQLLAAPDWNAVIVAYRNGAPVRVRDIGRAVDGPENNKLAAWVNGQPCIFLAVFKQPGANVIDTVDRIRAALPDLQAKIPAAIDVRILTDRTQTIRASVENVEMDLAIIVGLVVGVIFVFLRSTWATIIPGVTVPLALAGTFAAMYLLGYSLDNLSLMGLSIAVGFVVDDAIVMLENIVRHLEEGLTPTDAALKAAGEIGFTIISISLSLVAVFIPLLLMGGIIGRLFREFAVTVTVAIVVSAAVALTLTPMMGARFLKDEHAKKHGRLYQFFERMFDRLLAGYEWGLQRVFKHQLITLIVFLATLALTAWLFIIIPKGFFPQQDTGFISGTAEGAQDISSAAMQAHLQALAKVVKADPAVDSVADSSSTSAFNTGNFNINLKPGEQRDVTADQVIARLRPKLAQVEGANLYLQVLQDIRVGGRAGRTQYQYTLQDASLDELNVWAPKVLAKLQTIKQLADVTSDQQTNAATATLTIDRDRAARFGIQPALIDATISDAIGQRQVPLSSFVHVDLTKTAFLAINHQRTFPAVTISFNLGGGAALGDAVTAIQNAQRELNVPRTLSGSFQGTAQAFQTSLASQPYLIAAALAAVYLILGVLYESFIHPLTILSTLPPAGVGALLTLMAFGYDLSVIALIGIIMLIGIVKKNGIMMVDFALTAQREHGKSPRDAIYEACVLRFRPIMMTTMCAILGGVPLMLGGGTGSELRRPLGFAMVGGLIVSQALTLFTTPVVYLYLDRLSQWHGKRKQRGQEQPQEQKPAPQVHGDGAADQPGPA